MLTGNESRKHLLTERDSGLTDEEVSYASELNATFEFLVSEDLSTHALVPQVLLINGHRFCYRVNFDDARRETFLEFICIL